MTMTMTAPLSVKAVIVMVNGHSQKKSMIQFLPVLILALAPRCVVVSVADDGGDDGGAFGVDHLLELLAHFAP